MNVCHSCVTSGFREGNVAPAFVPNGKWTHKEQRRGGRGVGRGGKAGWWDAEKGGWRWRDGGAKTLEVQNVTPSHPRVTHQQPCNAYTHTPDIMVICGSWTTKIWIFWTLWLTSVTQTHLECVQEEESPQIRGQSWQKALLTFYMLPRLCKVSILWLEHRQVGHKVRKSQLTYH